jgi:hypothetical protein
MKKMSGFVALIALVAISACQKTDVGPWFDGTFDAALSEATARGELVFMEFYSDT